MVLDLVGIGISSLVLLLAGLTYCDIRRHRKEDLADTIEERRLRIWRALLDELTLLDRGHSIARDLAESSDPDMRGLASDYMAQHEKWKHEADAKLEEIEGMRENLDDISTGQSRLRLATLEARTMEGLKRLREIHELLEDAQTRESIRISQLPPT